MVISTLFLIHGLFALTMAQQQGTSNESVCNSCCQGVAGMPGIPGVPGPSGHNGLPGRDGLKGEPGEPGMNSAVKGEKGELGQAGPRGPVGKAGPPGLNGLGMKGDRGAPGFKGEPGSLHQRKSAFTAIKTSDQTGSSDVLTFQEVPTNINTDFNLSTNKFTCSVPGTYVFMFAIAIYQPTDPIIHLVKNGDVVVTAHSRTHTLSVDFDQATNGAILNLEVGDQVWLKFGYNGKRVHGNAVHKYNSFSGFLLYEN